jgi:hypothetical protein
MQVWEDSFEKVIISSRSSFMQHWFFKKIVLSLGATAAKQQIFIHVRGKYESFHA